MTHDILQTDIDLARRLLDARRPEGEIVETLGYRGVDSNRARQLIADLQAGKKVEPDKPIKINLAPKPVRETGASEERQSHGSTREEKSSRARPKPHKTSRIPWFTIIALASAAVCVGAFVLVSRKAHKIDSIERMSRTGDVPDADGKAGQRGAAGRIVNAKSIAIEVESEGVRLCGAPVVREDFLDGVFKILGAPTRTNQVEKADQIIYAYDACGLLFYAPKGSGHYSIVLDFDGSNGAAGTEKAFVGTFKIKDQVVQPSTDAASLSLIKELGLQSPQSASGIFRAQYGSFELVFGYLKSPERLSLVEIDFK